MAKYDDSESSDDGINDYTTTNVLLGYASRKHTDDIISQLGGEPVYTPLFLKSWCNLLWKQSDYLQIWIDTGRPPPVTLTSCSTCKNQMTLLLQLHADLPEQFPGHERRLFVFVCNRRTCRRKPDSVRVIRSTRHLHGQTETNISTVAESPNSLKSNGELAHVIGSSIFKSTFSPTKAKNSNPFSLSSSVQTNSSFSTTNSSGVTTTPSEGPCHSTINQPRPPEGTITDGLSTTFSQQARISAAPQSQEDAVTAELEAQGGNTPSLYPKYYLDSDYETLDAPTRSAGLSRSANMTEDSINAASFSGTVDDPEAFESKIDKTFQRFADRLSQNPQQILRYEFNGLPLLYSRTDAVGMSLALNQPSQHMSYSKGIPSCTNCGGQRVFELQLTPHAISVLEADEIGFEGMDWGTIIVGVCKQNCQPRALEKGRAGYLVEWAGVQWEEGGT